MTVEPVQEELEDVVEGSKEADAVVSVGVGSFLDGYGVGTLSLPIVITGHEGKGGGIGGK